MEDYSELTAYYIQHRIKLPKIGSKKIQEANQFITNPSSALKIILQSQSKDLSYQQVEKNHLSARLNRENKKITTFLQEEKNYQLNLISEKMRKYKPTNGSHSLFYANQLLMDNNRKRKNPLDSKLNTQLIRLQFGKKRNRSNKGHNNYSDRLSTSKLHESIVQGSEQSFFVSKLKQIRQTSEILRQNSRHLLKKAESAFMLNQNNYEKLKSDSNHILTGEEKYIFDEQIEWNSNGKKIIK